MRGAYHSLVLFIFVAQTIFGQQLTQYSQWSFHQFALNPAHAGIKPCSDLHTLFRTQWVGFTGAPKSGLVTFCAPLNFKRKEFLSARQGLGLRFEYDQIGQFSTNRLNFAYAGHFNFSRDNRLSLGLYGGVIQMGYNPAGSVTIEPDPQILREANFVLPDATFGAWWNSERYYAGLVVQNMIKSRWNGLGTNSYFRTHVTINGGYLFKINDAVSLLPTVLIKVPPKLPWSMDIQTTVDIKNIFDTGLGFRNGDALMFFVGYKYKQRFSIMYSFDLTTSPLKKYSNNTHELSLSFNSCGQGKKSSMNCPLFE